ncbi:hypothetical protein Fcan01_23750 [Folsomia candida]|uniref:Uncharacterized protein n=1 Tax=Folsomia candida TaxID=158441 RepID=A0A226D754_FOLCA|nr:hypothetical protein Fcan01_23750 [Folsomia candida]
MMSTTNILLPVGLGLVVLFNPCMPPFLGSFILPLDHCQQRQNFSRVSGLSLGLAIVEAVSFTQIFVAGTFYNIDGLLPGIAYVVMECNRAIEFDRMEISKFREIQVLEKLLNDCFKKRIFPIVAWTLPILQIAFCFSMIQLHDKISFAAFPMYVGMYVDCVVFNMLVFVGAARVNTISVGWITKFVKDDKIRNSKWKMKAVSSFRPLRGEFGSNFADALTPLVIQDFCSSQTASLLLLAGKTK